MYTYKELEDNFFKIEKIGINYTTVMFDRLSKIEVKIYCSYYKKPWKDVLVMFGVYDLLYDYITREYKRFIIETGKVGISAFTCWNELITTKIINSIGFDYIKNDCGIKKNRYSDDDYENNFNSIRNTLKKIPQYNDFRKLTKIQIESYANRYQLNGKVYNQLVKKYVSNDEYLSYLKEKSLHRKEVSSFNGKLACKISEEQLIANMKVIFNDYLNKYGVLPSKRLFNKISIYDDSYYRKHFNMSWIDVCNIMGYKKDKNHTEEKILLEMIKNIVNCEYIPQKTWKWLIGVGGSHMYCDGYFPEINLVVEYDGAGHRKCIEKFGGENRFEITKTNDKLKDQLLKEHNIKILRIDSRSSWYREETLVNLLKGV